MCGCSRGGMVAPGGVCMVALGGHAWLLGGRAWLLWGGVRGCSQGGVHGCSGGGIRGCSGGLCGFIRGACMVFSVFSDTMRYGQ